MKRKATRMIRVKCLPQKGSMAKQTGEEFWVKDTNPYFNWYKKSKVWKIEKEKVL